MFSIRLGGRFLYRQSTKSTRCLPCVSPWSSSDSDSCHSGPSSAPVQHLPSVFREDNSLGMLHDFLRPAAGCPTPLPLYFRTFCTEVLGSMKIYTKTGDKGKSSLYDGQRRRKDDPTFEALGDVDELNSALGLAHEYCAQANLLDTLQQVEEIQSRLLDVGSAVATPLDSLSSKKVARVKFNADLVFVLEKWIDQMDEELPPLTGFILPSGGLPASSLHVARSVCRRAERKVVYLVAEELVEQSVAQYLNRLSDYLFTAARYTALKMEKPETLWRKL